MSDKEKIEKEAEKEPVTPTTPKKEEKEEKKVAKKPKEDIIDSVEEEDDKDDDLSFSLETSAADDLPEDIKQKLEKNKAARAKKTIKRKKARAPRVVKTGRVYIQATYNNTLVTIADSKGNVISWASAGVAGFRGAKKATPYAAQIITKIAVTKAKEEYGLKEVSVFLSGIGTGRESAVRALNANGLEVTAIKDTTPVPHNGCRPRRPRRV